MGRILIFSLKKVGVLSVVQSEKKEAVVTLDALTGRVSIGCAPKFDRMFPA
jgi:hypothetical protein